MDVCLAFSDSELQSLCQCEVFANTLLKITSDLRKGTNTVVFLLAAALYSSYTRVTP